MQRFLVNHWFLTALVIGLIGAGAFPERFGWATAWIEPRWVIAFALLLMAWTMPSRNLLAELKWPVPSLWAALVSCTVVPLGAWGLGSLVPLADVGVGLLISASVPCTLASAVLWTRLAGGNEATALLVILISTLMSCVTTTAWLVTLIGAGVQVPFSAMMRDLLATLVLPVGVGQLSRAWPPLALFA